MAITNLRTLICIAVPCVVSILVAVTWLIDTGTKWYFQPGPILRHYYFYYNLSINVVTAAVEAILLCWIATECYDYFYSILRTKPSIKLQRMVILQVPIFFTSKLEVSVEEVVFTHQDIVTELGTLTIALDTKCVDLNIIKAMVAKGKRNYKNDALLPILATSQPTISAERIVFIHQDINTKLGSLTFTLDTNFTDLNIIKAMFAKGKRICCTLKSNISAERIVFNQRDITTKLGSLKIALCTKSADLNIIMAMVAKGNRNYENGTLLRILYTLKPDISAERIICIYQDITTELGSLTFALDTLMHNNENDGLLQLLLRHVKFCATNGTMRVVDRTSWKKYFVEGNFKLLKLCEHRSIGEDQLYTYDKQLYAMGFTAKVGEESHVAATLGCAKFKLQFANVSERRDQPYSSSTMNMLLGRQHWMLDTCVQLAGLYIGDCCEVKRQTYECGEIFFTKQIDIHVTSYETTAKVQVKVECPIDLEYSPLLAGFIEWVFRFMAFNQPSGPTQVASPTTQDTLRDSDTDTYDRMKLRSSFGVFPLSLRFSLLLDKEQPRSTNNPTASLPDPTNGNTFLALLRTNVTLGTVAFCLLNEHNSCLLLNWKKLTMSKMDGNMNLHIQGIALKLQQIDGNELTVEQIIIERGDDTAQGWSIVVGKTIATWDSNVNKHIMQMVKEVKLLIAQLQPLMPPSQPGGQRLHGSLTCNGMTIYIPLFGFEPAVTIEIKKIFIKVSERFSVTVDIEVHAIVHLKVIAKDILVRIESAIEGFFSGWTITIDGKGPFPLDTPVLVRYVFNEYAPMREWLARFDTQPEEISYAYNLIAPAQEYHNRVDIHAEEIRRRNTILHQNESIISNVFSWPSNVLGQLFSASNERNEVSAYRYTPPVQSRRRNSEENENILSRVISWPFTAIGQLLSPPNERVYYNYN